MAPTDLDVAETSNTPEANDSAIEAKIVAGEESRLSKIEAMAEKQEAEREAEREAENAALAEGLDNAETEEAVDAAPAVSQTTPAVDESPFVLGPDGKRRAKLKVYGQEIEVTEAELIRMGQKEVAADVRLREAAERERRVQEAERILQANAAADRQREAAMRETEAQQQNRAVLRETVEHMAVGEIDAAVEKLESILKAGRPVTTPIAVPPEQIQALVDQRLQQTTAALAAQQEAKSVLSVWETEFKDLAASPENFDRVDRVTKVIAADNPTLAPEDVIREAGRFVRERLKTTQTDPRQQRRADLKPAVVGRNAPAPLGSPQPAPSTVLSAINEMRALRGQAAR